jgi:hypothetical protein
MAYDDAQVAKINSMCGTAQGLALGTAIKNLETSAAALGGASGLVKGTYTVVAGDDTANTKSIATGLTAITGFIVQVYRADILMSSIKVTKSNGNLIVSDNSTTYVLTTGDVINYICW